MRNKRALINILSSFLLEVVTIFCGLIVPRFILEAFGSSVNGTISSITQFLGYIVLFESGMGGVIKAALYKPLANNDITVLSGIMKASERTFKKIAYIFIGFIFFIAVFYPFLAKNVFDWLFTFALVIIIGASTFARYYFGITYQIMLDADQKTYVTSGIQILSLLINTILSVILIKLGANILFVKLGSAIVFVARPIAFNLYVKSKYKIIKNCKPDGNAIKQKWDGFGQQIANFVLNNTDIVILTLFTNMKEVSVYSVYIMPVSGIVMFLNSISAGLSAAIGDMLAKNEQDSLDRTFTIFEFVNFTVTTVLFTSTAFLIVPFVSVYTKGVTDANYFRPLFAYVLTAAQAVFCIRMPYSCVASSAGHYRQTRNGAFIEAAINIVLSLILVNRFGVVGVAIGTLAAMLFRTVQYVLYLSKNILYRNVTLFAKRCAVNGSAVVITILLVRMIPGWDIRSYSMWCGYAVLVTTITLGVTLTVSAIFYFKDMKNLYQVMKRVVIH